MIRINIAKDFSVTPGPRYTSEGENSGELFRNSILIPKLKEAIEKDETLEINLDGGIGYGSGFLEEAFGVLSRDLGFYHKKELNRIVFVSNEQPGLINEIKECMGLQDKQETTKPVLKEKPKGKPRYRIIQLEPLPGFNVKRYRVQKRYFLIGWLDTDSSGVSFLSLPLAKEYLESLEKGNKPVVVFEKY